MPREKGRKAVAQKAGSAAQSVLTNGFGIIAFISVTPLIAVQALGILYNAKLRRAKLRQEALEAQEFEALASFAAGLRDEDEEANAEEAESAVPEPAKPE